MYKLYSYWSAPKAEDVEATNEGFEGGGSIHYRIAEMVFPDKAAFQAATESDEWATLHACSGTMIERFGVSLTVEAGEEVIADLPGS
jgi:hypothetical protein